MCQEQNKFSYIVVPDKGYFYKIYYDLITTIKLILFSVLIPASTKNVVPKYIPIISLLINH